MNQATSFSDQMRNRFKFDSPNNEVTIQALRVVQELNDWFEAHDPEATSKPNLRIGRELVGVCLGEQVLWNSNDNKLEELTIGFMLRSYELDLRARLDQLTKWVGDGILS